MKFIELAKTVGNARACAYRARECLADLPMSKERELIVDLQFWLLELTDMLHDVDVTLSANEDLLKEQEPRVMTLEEVKVCKEPVYLEVIPFSVFGSFFNWGLVCTANENNVTVSVMLRNATMRHCACAMYGKRWRCWTAKPTNKQSEAAKWDE